MKAFQFLVACLCLTISAIADQQPEILTVNADGSFSNTNVVGNLAGFAAAQAQSAIAQAVAEAAHTSATNTERIVRDGIAEVQAGAKIEYSDLFVWSAGAFALSTNASCNIYHIEMHKDITTNVSGIVHFAVDISYWFSEDIGSYQPGVKYSTNLDATNSWEMCIQDDAVGPFRATIGPELTVDNAYRTRNWMPLYLSSAFFKAFTDSAAPGTGVTIDLVGGVKNGFTGRIVIPPTGKWLVVDVDGGVITTIEARDTEP